MTPKFQNVTHHMEIRGKEGKLESEPTLHGVKRGRDRQSLEKEEKYKENPPPTGQTKKTDGEATATVSLRIQTQTRGSVQRGR